jgi:Leucine-rich repeat (LRR) protein
MARNKGHRRAEEKIEKARRSEARELDLRIHYSQHDSEKLTELPDSLTALTQLQSLNLSDNRLTALPESFAQLNRLQSLNLTNNQLTALPDSLTQLNQLQSLNLANNQLMALPDSLGQLSHLQWLNLNGNRLTALPNSINQLKELRSLSLYYNRLTALPDSLSQLTQLQWLSLGGNQLAVLPEWLGQLTQLQSLSLANNQMTAFPKWLRQLTQLLSLSLADNQLTVLPEWLGHLTQLHSLSLGGNKLTKLPDSLGQLTRLQSLSLGANQLTALPESLGRLTQLRMLVVDNNRLTTLPEGLGCLTLLDDLTVNGNLLTTLPLSLANLKNLTQLWLGNPPEDGNPLSTLPESIRGLTNLETLCLSKCDLSELPDWLCELTAIKDLDLEDNPLNPELAAAYETGIEGVKRYLRELAKGTRKRYEAKLLILGDGNEGKTCISRAIRGLPFQPQVTTRGVDVEQWKFEHPDHAGNADKEITLNIWDFEGQEINHQTHQFFLTTQALYLLVFRCRDQFPMARAEYWLDTIRARAPQAKVAIVISESEKRTPYVPQDKLQAGYGDLLSGEKWLFAVGCEDDSGVLELQDSLKRWAADLEFMGRKWPESYSRAEEAIKDKANEGIPHINRGQLSDIFRGCSINESIFKDLAGSMSTLGVMTQFPDCPDLRDFIVLQPQWLTKAISEIMEDRQLASDKGEIALQRMESIWEANAYSGMFPTFHNCMKEFELCYDLEDASRSCLVPLRFGYQKPQIPWSDGNGMKERRVEYKLNIRPPTGLMSRFIVKTHHMMVTTAAHPKGVYWHNGVFLRTGAGLLTSEALCEFDSDSRRLRIQVRAAFPQNLLEQVHGYVKAVFSFFRGMEAERSYGCIKIEDQTKVEHTCSGLHTEKRIFSEIINRQILNCEYGLHKVDPTRLIWGISSFAENVIQVVPLDQLRRVLDEQPAWADPLMRNIRIMLDWVDENGESINLTLAGQARLLPEIKQQLDLKLHEYLAYTSQMLDDREHTAAPGIISISTKDRSKWNPASYFQKTYILTPFCECEGNIHPSADGQVEFTKDREWWETTAPWIARGTKLLAAGLQLAFAGMPLALGPRVFDAIKDEVEFMNELTQHMELEADTAKIAGAAELLQGDVGKDLRGTERESRLMRAALARFLQETAPTNYRAQQWGSLRRVRMSDNSYRWMCEPCGIAVKN